MKTNTQATCLHLSVQNGNHDLVRLILSEFNNDNGYLNIFLNEEAEPFGTPLHIAGNLISIETFFYSVVFVS